MTKKKYEYEKGRDWTFIVYPESAPDNWRTVLGQLPQSLDWGS